MAKKVDRIIIDTNLWIAFLITKDFRKLDVKIKTGKVKILFSLELIEEFMEVAERPKFKKYFNKKDLEQIIDLFDVYGEIVDVKSRVEICRDPKDNFLLSLAKDSKATHLITGDKDILDIKKFEKTSILKITDYLTKTLNK
ncbi:MAG: putative toxin-antitoxin system toxin component, PIN family [Cytophagales bacterium]|nr:putative toxin-antitoxin system toxin component, PIN family [Cytophagales bacterium]